MATFPAPLRKGKFLLKDEWIVVKRFMGMEPGQPVRKVTGSRLRLWWRRGGVAAKSSLDPKHLAALEAQYLKAHPEAAPVEEVEGDQAGDAPLEEDGSSDEQKIEDVPEKAIPISTREGDNGWWPVSFDDGTVKNFRRADVVEMGLLEK